MSFQDEGEDSYYQGRIIRERGVEIQELRSKLTALRAENEQLRAVHEAELGVCEQHCEVVTALRAVPGAAKALTDKLTLVHAAPSYQSVWAISQAHQGRYIGPTYTDELVELCAALAALGEGEGMRFAYADPPYIGQAKRHYADDPNCAEVDHELLIAELDTYDAWALSLSVPSLRVILPMTPEDSRVCAWVKPFASFKPGVRVAYAWEPVVVKGWRKGTREDRTVRDWVAANITLQRGTHGAKPDDFCFWLFDVMGLERTDDLIDLFPGSGAVTQAWDAWCRQGVLV